MNISIIPNAVPVPIPTVAPVERPCLLFSEEAAALVLGVEVEVGLDLETEVGRTITVPVIVPAVEVLVRKAVLVVNLVGRYRSQDMPKGIV